MTSPVTLLTDAVARDSARPRVTWYDDETGERVELSGATLRTWVAKTAHLLAGELLAGPGTTVSVDLPRHWTAAIWWLAIDAVGAKRCDPAGPCDVAVIGPHRLAQLPAADEIVAVSMRPMGAPFAEPLPALVHDYFDAARSQPDDYPFGSRATDPTGEQDAVRAAELARTWQLSSLDRVMAVGAWAGADPAVAELFAPLAADASVVWVRNPASATFVQRLESERVTAVVDTRSGEPPPPRIRVLAPVSVSFSRPPRPH